MAEVKQEDCVGCVVQKIGNTKTIIVAVIAMVVLLGGAVTPMVTSSQEHTPQEMAILQARVTDHMRQIEELEQQRVETVVELATIKAELKHLRADTVEVKTTVRSVSDKIDLLLRSIK